MIVWGLKWGSLLSTWEIRGVVASRAILCMAYHSFTTTLCAHGTPRAGHCLCSSYYWSSWTFFLIKERLQRSPSMHQQGASWRMRDTTPCTGGILVIAYALTVASSYNEPMSACCAREEVSVVVAAMSPPFVLSHNWTSFCIPIPLGCTLPLLAFQIAK